MCGFCGEIVHELDANARAIIWMTRSVNRALYKSSGWPRMDWRSGWSQVLSSIDLYPLSGTKYVPQCTLFLFIGQGAILLGKNQTEIARQTSRYTIQLCMALPRNKWPRRGVKLT